MTGTWTLIALAPVLGALGSILLYYARTGVPPVPSSAGEIADVIALLREAALPDGATIYELGCGLGTMALALAEAFPSSKVIGVEISPVPYWIARVRTRGRASIVRADFNRVPLGDADAITAYLMIDAAARLAPVLDAHVRPGTIVVASAFWFRDRAPTVTLRMAARYVWPARKEDVRLL